MHSPHQLILSPFQSRASTSNTGFSHQGTAGDPIRKTESPRCKALQHGGRPLILMPLELVGPTNKMYQQDKQGQFMLCPGTSPCLRHEQGKCSKGCTLQGEDFTADWAVTSPVSQRLFVLATIMLVVGRSREGCRTGFGAFVEVWKINGESLPSECVSIIVIPGRSLEIRGYKRRLVESY